LAEAKRKKEKNSKALQHTLNCLILSIVVYMVLESIESSDAYGYVLSLLLSITSKISRRGCSQQ